MFGLSYGDVLLLMVGTVVLLGPKDLPIIARAAGRLTGRAVGYMQTMRGQVDTVLQQSQANNLQKELREAMAQLDAIRYEVRSGMSIVQPRPFVRESFENHGSSLQQATKLVKSIESTLDRFVDGTSAQSNVHTQKPVRNVDSNSVDLQRQATSYARFAGHLGKLEKPDNVKGTCPTSTQTAKSSKENEKEIPVLPISAVSIGLYPTRNGPISGGSDLVLESVVERKVAQQALEFLQQQTSEFESTST